MTVRERISKANDQLFDALRITGDEKIQLHDATALMGDFFLEKTGQTTLLLAEASRYVAEDPEGFRNFVKEWKGRRETVMDASADLSFDLCEHWKLDEIFIEDIGEVHVHLIGLDDFKDPQIIFGSERKGIECHICGRLILRNDERLGINESVRTDDAGLYDHQNR